MLLSIDRVLQLIGEGKSIEKISELAECSSEDVVFIIEEARKILQKHEKSISRKKFILKKSRDDDSGTMTDNRSKTIPDSKDLFPGTELSAVPLDSILTIYTDGASLGNPGDAGIGIVILDKEDRQVGKVSAYIGKGTNNFAEYTAVIRALKIAIYFNVRELKIRTDSELIVKQLTGEYKVKNENIRKLYEEATKLIREIKKVRVEHVTRNFNEKADYLAKKGASLSSKAK